MSGFNRRTGLFELTLTKALWWSRFRRHERPVTMADVALLLRRYGIPVEAVHSRWLEAKGSQEAIYSVLSGWPRTFYQRKDEEVPGRPH